MPRSNELGKITAEDLKGITYIRPYAFAGTGCYSIEIPTTVTMIGENAFYHSYVSEIKYAGTLAELQALFEDSSDWEAPAGGGYGNGGQFVCSDGTKSWSAGE